MRQLLRRRPVRHREVSVFFKYNLRTVESSTFVLWGRLNGVAGLGGAFRCAVYEE